MHTFSFGPFRLEPGERRLLRDGEPVALTPKAFDTLVALVERAGRVVTKDELFQLVWPDATVEEGTLAQNVFTLRRALGDDTRYIETVPKIGYRFIEPVAREEAESTAVARDRPRGGWPVRVAALVAAAVLLAGTLLYWWPGRRARVGASTPRVVAVLPFRPIQQDQPNEILGLGMADALIAKLGGVGQLVVRSTASVARY